MSLVLTNPAFLSFLIVVALVFGVGVIALLVFNHYI